MEFLAFRNGSGMQFGPYGRYLPSYMPPHAPALSDFGMTLMRRILGTVWATFEARSAVRVKGGAPGCSAKRNMVISEISIYQAILAFPEWSRVPKMSSISKIHKFCIFFTKISSDIN